MATGFIDIQVNGYGGTNFNTDTLTAEQLHACCEKLQAHGVAGILATFTSEQPDTIIRRIGNLLKLRAADPLAQKIIPGIHIEGPYMSAEAGYRGAHPVEAMKPADLETIKKFHDTCQSLLRIVTVAPEQDTACKSIAFLAQNKVTVSGGHSNATMDQLKAALDAGLSMWTHLGNGCPVQMHRHDNIIQRVLSLSDHIWCCFIGDGVHVPLFALKNYLRAANPDRTIVVTDAVWPAGLGPGKFNMGRWGEVTIGEDLAIWAPDKSHFLGSASTMPKVRQNLVTLGLPESTIDNLLIHHPAKIASPS
jgi:N-acetylglucosamine-6-phosphate deacetylase